MPSRTRGKGASSQFDVVKLPYLAVRLETNFDFGHVARCICSPAREYFYYQKYTAALFGNIVVYSTSECCNGQRFPVRLSRRVSPV